MSPCLVCKDLNPSNVDQKGKYYYKGDLATLLKSGYGCLSCSLLKQGILHFFGQSDLDKYTSERKLYHNQLRVGGVGKLLQVSLAIWTLPSPPKHLGRNIVNKTLEFYILPDCPELPWKGLSNAPHWHEPIQQYTTNNLPTWLDECTNLHRECQQALRRRRLPTRVIDVGNTTVGFYQRLFVSSGEEEPYLCLSHCWGDYQPIRTTKANIEDHKQNIPWQLLPQTFQDVIDLTRFLNIRYLWIDSLCIIQDDRNDWARESIAMAGIYGNSYLTVSATAAANCSQGLYATSDSGRIGPHELKTVLASGKEVCIYVSAIPNHEPFENLDPLGVYSGDYADCPLKTRAWCFQEHLLSTRIIQFGPQEIVWECKSLLRCTCGRIHSLPQSRADKFPRHLYPPDGQYTDEEMSHHSWYTGTVSSFSSRLLKYPTDRLVALAGVAQVVRSGHKAKYLAGLWDVSLLYGLCWYLSPSATTKRPLHIRPKEYIAPSWSWASLNQHVIWTVWYLKPGEFDAEVLRAQCFPENTMGAVRDGSISVRGALVKGEYYRKDIGGSIADLVRVNDVEQDFWADYPIEIEMFQEKRPREVCFLLRLAHVRDNKQFVARHDHMAQLRALVLKESDSKDSYKRIGYLEAYAQEVFDWFEGQEKTIITIV